MRPLLLILLLLISKPSFSQFPFNNHSDTSVYYPISYTHNYDYARIRIDACDLDLDSATIDTLSIFIDTVGQAYDTVNVVYRIYLSEEIVPMQPQLITNLLASATLVYDDTIVLNSSMDSSWLLIPFTVPYNYQGGHLNVIFESVNQQQLTIDSNEIRFLHHYPRSGPFHVTLQKTRMQVWNSNSGIPVDSGTIYNFIPNIKLAIHTTDGCGPMNCLNTHTVSCFPENPQPGDTVICCLDVPLLGSGYTYQWQAGFVSCSSGPWVNIPNTNSPCYQYIRVTGNSYCVTLIADCSNLLGPPETIASVIVTPAPFTAIDVFHQSHTIKISPNPSSDYFRIDINEKESSCQLYIFNQNGQAIKTVNNVNPNQQINIEDLDDGFYFIELISGNNIYRSKLVKM